MYLGKITAVGAKLFPDIGNRIQTDNINTLISKIKHVEDHFIQHHRIAVVKIPLVWIKSGHNMLLDILQPGKVTRSCSGEYLQDRFLRTAQEYHRNQRRNNDPDILFHLRGRVLPIDDPLRYGS